jgi:hypothetical protein
MIRELHKKREREREKQNDHLYKTGNHISQQHS